MLCLVALSPVTYLDAAAIRGRVVDASSDIYLQGVEVRILETEHVMFTERGGNFRFSGISEGEYNVEVTPMGYPRSRERVTIVYPDEEVYVLLQVGGDEVFDMAEFEVSAGLLGQAKAINIQRSADNLLNVVSSDAFGEFVDRNAAEALQRVVGVTVEDNQGEGFFVIIRGADRNLSTVAIDGVQVATPEEDGRATGLNLIAIEQLESIELTKTWLPRQPANFIGGAVNLITRSALDREGQFMSIDIGYGKYTISDLWSQKISAVYGNVWGGDRVKFGFQMSLNQSTDNRGSETASVGSWLSKVNLGSAVRFSPYGFRSNALNLDDFVIERERQGASTKLELQLGRRHNFELSISHNRFNNDEVRQGVEYSPASATHMYAGPKTLTERIANQLGYDLTDPKVIARVYAPNAAQRILYFDHPDWPMEALRVGELNYDFDRQAYTYSKWTDGGSQREWSSSLVEDEITTFNFGGKHDLSDALSINYKVHRSSASKENHVNSIRFNSSGSINLTVELIDNLTVMSDPGGQMNNPDRFRIYAGSGNVQDNIFYSDDERSGGEVNLVYKWTTGRLSHQMEVGAYYDAREKSYRRDFNRFSSVNTGVKPWITISDPIWYNGIREDFLPEYGGFYHFGPSINTAVARNFVSNPGTYGVSFNQVQNDITEAVSNAILRDYGATEDIKSTYLMHSVDVGRLRLIAGLRYELTENSFTNNLALTRSDAYVNDQGVPIFIQPVDWQTLISSKGQDSFIASVRSERDYDHVLGALHAIYRYSDSIVIRAAITQTIARPDYTDLVPREIVGASGATYSSSATMPNFDLMPLESLNYDLNADYYFKGFGYISLGVFYKDLDGPIYTQTSDVEVPNPTAVYLTNKYSAVPENHPGAWRLSERVNAGKGELYGLEFVYEQKYSSLPGFLSGLGITANFAIMESAVSLPERDLVRAGEEVPLFRQPDKLANFSVFWEKYNILIRTSLLFKGKYLDDTTTTGTRIEDLIATGFPTNSYDIYIKESTRLDLFVRYRLSRGLSIYFEGTNLTNEPIVYYYGTEWRMRMRRHTRPIYFVGLRWNY
jgi:TonB-dependent receptor